MSDNPIIYSSIKCHQRNTALCSTNLRFENQVIFIKADKYRGIFPSGLPKTLLQKAQGVVSTSNSDDVYLPYMREGLLGLSFNSANWTEHLWPFQWNTLIDTASATLLINTMGKPTPGPLFYYYIPRSITAVPL